MITRPADQDYRTKGARDNIEVRSSRLFYDVFQIYISIALLSIGWQCPS